MTWKELFNTLSEYGGIEIKTEYMDWFVGWLKDNHPGLEYDRTETTYGKSVLKLKQ